MQKQVILPDNFYVKEEHIDEFIKTCQYAFCAKMPWKDRPRFLDGFKCDHSNEEISEDETVHVVFVTKFLN